jgi:hypothetical protein
MDQDQIAGHLAAIAEQRRLLGQKCGKPSAPGPRTITIDEIDALNRVLACAERLIGQMAAELDGTALQGATPCTTAAHLRPRL